MALIASPRYPFKEAVMFGVPDEAGVYSLYFGGDLLYIGVARGHAHGETLRTQLLAHAAGELRPSVATHFRWEITHEPQKRLAEMLDLLGPGMPPYNQPGAG